MSNQSLACGVAGLAAMVILSPVVLAQNAQKPMASAGVGSSEAARPGPLANPAGVPPITGVFPAEPGSVGATRTVDGELHVKTIGTVPEVVSKSAGMVETGAGYVKKGADLYVELNADAVEPTWLGLSDDELKLRGAQKLGAAADAVGKIANGVSVGVTVVNGVTAAADCVENGVKECWGRAGDAATDAAVTGVGFVPVVGPVFSTAHSVTSILDKTLIGGLTGKSFNDRLNERYAKWLDYPISDEEAFNKAATWTEDELRQGLGGPTTKDYDASRGAMKSEGVARYEASASTYQAQQAEHDRQQAVIARQQAEAQRQAMEAQAKEAEGAAFAQGLQNITGAFMNALAPNQSYSTGYSSPQSQLTFDYGKFSRDGAELLEEIKKDAKNDCVDRSNPDPVKWRDVPGCVR